MALMNLVIPISSLILLKKCKAVATQCESRPLSPLYSVDELNISLKFPIIH